jgi:parallel beta-helix repeat protein
MASTAHAATLNVNCGARNGLNSIGAALKVLQGGESRGPDAINVKGACHENVVIQSMDRLTLNAVNGASITDTSGGTDYVMQVLKSSTVDVKGFIVNGGIGVICAESSTCTFSGNTFQESVGDGVAIFRSYSDLLSSNIIQNNAGNGLFVSSGAVVRTIDLQIRNNGGAGAQAVAGGNMTFFTSSSMNNGGDGILARTHSTVRINGFTAQGNGGAGVAIGDLSFAWFQGEANNITGNHGGADGITDVECLPQYSATRGVATTGGTTNCVEQTEEGLFATQIQLDSAEIPPGNPNVVSAFIPTGRDSEVCFVSLGDSGFYLGSFAPTTCLGRTYQGQKGLVVILSTIGWELPSDFVMRVSVYHKGAKYYGQPIYWPGD